MPSVARPLAISSASIAAPLSVISARGRPRFRNAWRQPVHQALGGLVEIPLQVADQARAIVEDAEQHRLDPGAGAGEHLARAVVEVQVPERADVLDLEAAHLQLLEAVAGRQRAVGGPLGPRLA